jgi:uncharacterized membrane protein YfhO
VALIPFAYLANITNLVVAYKTMLFTITVLCGISSYYCINRLLNNTFVAAVSSLLYTFCVYRLEALYFRSGLSEAITFIYVPIVILGLYEIIKGDYRKWYIIATGYILFLYTHALSSVLMFITMLLLMLFYYKSFLKEPKRFYYLLLAGLVTVVISMYYWLPLLEQNFSNTFGYHKHLGIESVGRFIALPLNLIVKGLLMGFTPLMMFIPGIGLSLTVVVGLRLFVYEQSPARRSLDICILLGLFYVVISCSLFPWESFPLNKLSFIQFAWRLYEFSSFFFAMAGGYYLYRLLHTRIRRIACFAGIIFCCILILKNESYVCKKYYSWFYDTHKGIIDNQGLVALEYVPYRVPGTQGYPPSLKYVEARGDTVVAGNSNTHISNLVKDKGITRFDVSPASPDSLELPLFYYKGYRAELNGHEVAVEQSQHGLIQLNVAEPGHVKVYYGGTAIQKWSYYVSIAGIIIFIVAVCLYKRKKHVYSENK